MKDIIYLCSREFLFNKTTSMLSNTFNHFSSGKRAKTWTLAATMALFSSTAAMGQQTNNSPDWLKDFTSRIELHGYAQGGYSWQDKNGKDVNDFNLKRTLFWAKARITDRWSFLFMYDFSSVVQEFYTDYRFSKDQSLSVRLGQFKHSFSMENPLSPTMLELVDVYSQAALYLAGEGPDPLNGVNYGRDMGLMVYGSLFNSHLIYELAVMNGQGINCRDGNNNKDLIVKLDYRPLDGFRIVGTAQKGKGHAVGVAAWNPGVQLGDDYRRDRVSIGAEWKKATEAGKASASGGISIRGEYMAGKDGDVTSRGGYLTGSVALGKGVDIIASADYYDHNIDMDYGQTQLTGGIQYWFYKKCRLQLQYTRTLSDYQDDYNWLQAQVQVAF